MHVCVFELRLCHLHSEENQMATFSKQLKYFSKMLYVWNICRIGYTNFTAVKAWKGSLQGECLLPFIPLSCALLCEKWSLKAQLYGTVIICVVLECKTLRQMTVSIIAQRDATMSSLFIYCKVTLQVSGVVHTHHQEYMKL